MKNIRFITITLFALLLLNLVSCEKEQVIIEEHSRFNVKSLNQEQIQSNPPLIKKLSKLNYKKKYKHSNNSEAREIYNPKYGFTINTDYIKYIEDTENGNHSYSFPITRDNPTNDKLENLLLHSNSENGYDAYIIQYGFTASQYASLDENNINTFKTLLFPIDFDTSIFNNGELTRAVYECSETWEYITHTGHEGGELHGINSDGTCAVGCNYGTSEWVLTDISCGWYDDGTGGGDDVDETEPAEGGGGGVDYNNPIASPTTNPEPSDAELLAKSIAGRLNLSEIERNWLMKQDALVMSLNETLASNSIEAENEVRMIIKAEIVNHPDNNTPQWDYSRSGTFPNRPSLEYKATHNPNLGETMYLLKNGLVLYQSSTNRKINKSVSNSISSTEVSTDGYNYIYSYQNKKWYEYRLPPPTYVSADIDFLLGAFWDGVKIVGRYATPVEDIIILIDGNDFDGVEQSKAQTAGFMILGFIPGGKIVKPISKVVKGTQVWRVVIRSGGKTFTRVVRELTEDVLQHLERYAPGTKDLIDDALRKGEVLDHEIIIEASEVIEDISISKGRNLTWQEVKALFKRGNDFNKKALDEEWYDFHEIYLSNGKRLDSYDPLTGEIVSRKATDLGEVQFSTFEKYLREMHQKYAPGTVIRSNKYSDLDGLILHGQQILEIPASNQSLSNIQDFIDFARDNYDIEIRFRPE
ncbi:hypothetical protein [Pontimicrobium aquaticum]|uniref:Uncharacterized protein n=1 Tax=Pontimicrobium aquaticum TaxID=2565367 RepID=A0A4U0F118_9FLAO|nr:hypothetical protein [Pontimicrobium aquaticum]TJY37938.1 hypothetical protein E5167_01390 [Pontimicrobium aquaticum]